MRPISASAGADATIFTFELDFAGTLVCIPMCVRLKLDRIGVKVSLKEWNKFPAAVRHTLVALPCSDMSQTTAYRQQVIALMTTYTSNGVTEWPRETAPVWDDPGKMPDRIAAYAESLGVRPPNAAQWAALNPLQRFSLFKLTRPGHSNDNFLPALREFGLLES